jgi:hypothetical protein
VQQLKLLLEESSTDCESDRDSDSSSSYGPRKESDSSSSNGPRKEKYKKCKKTKKKDIQLKKNKVNQKKKSAKIKKDRTQKKSKKHKKKRLPVKQSECAFCEHSDEAGVGTRNTQDDNIKLGASSLNSDQQEEDDKQKNTCTGNVHDKTALETACFGPSPQHALTDKKTTGNVLVESFPVDFSTSAGQNRQSGAEANGRTVVCESEVQRELKRFRMESLQLTGQLLH